jgi:orotidine-5'-phosphate decarboxylase
VVGATYPDEARRLRVLMPQQIFLVPGYGAQGATAADCAAAFKPDGTGAIVNASRSVIFAHLDNRYAGLDWEKAVEQAARAFAQDIRSAVTASK